MARADAPRLRFQQPLPRQGQPEDVAGLVSYFVRDEASFVSGQVVYVAGGPKA